MAFLVKNYNPTVNSNYPPVLDQWIRVQKSAADLPASTSQDIFTISGGRVLVRALIGEVTTVFAAGTTPDLKVTINPSGSGTTVDVATDVVVASDEVGTLYSCEGDGTALVAVSSGYAPVPMTGFVLNPGTLSIVTSETITGATKWDIYYLPLDESARVVSA